MTDKQFETLQLLAASLTGDADMYGGPYSYHCYRKLLIQGYVEEHPRYPEWVRITEKGKLAVVGEEVRDD